MSNQCFIGCSGYYYQAWKGEFYPQGLPTSKWLTYYSEIFNSIEINSTFYKFPTVKSLQGFYNKTPQSFRISIKVNREITHYKKFKNVDKEIKEFYAIARDGLKDKLGALLFQMPPKFVYTPENLYHIINSLDGTFDNVLEFRHSSWWIPEVYDVLTKNNITFCSVSYPGLPDDVIKTTSMGYIRMHGNQKLFESTYSSLEIGDLEARIRNANFQDTYVYFNNTMYNGALENAQSLMKLMN